MHRKSGEEGIMKTIALVLIVGLIALMFVLPVSAAGQGGNGMMVHSGSGSAGTGVCINPDCPQDCPYDQTQPRDGTGVQYGKGGFQ
ncbi:hypothetical protein [Methanospirillum lacunae]|uniref:Uncharacterized protein n=1 Tax=Methanospirillum lacunae TaxID=668570 RepID=A0A2V2N2X4_9EURY|nr:hypothetical protein [Methanospirillum lacunae]PWR70878.1 hypothetical protein DK846_12870 [Methanospirillum lacunae]